MTRAERLAKRVSDAIEACPRELFPVTDDGIAMDNVPSIACITLRGEVTITNKPINRANAARLAVFLHENFVRGDQ